MATSWPLYALVTFLALLVGFGIHPLLGVGLWLTFVVVTRKR